MNKYLNEKFEGNLEAALYFQMLRIRELEEAIADRYPEGKMRCPTHLSIGQEGTAAACGTALLKEDFAVSTHRGHAHYLSKLGDSKAFIAEIYGKETGCAKGFGGSMHLIDKSVNFMGTVAIVGGSIPIGVGLGLSIKLNQTSQVSCVYLGDGSIEEGVFFESANFAAVKNLPVVFICENNLYSVYSPLKVRQPKGRKIYEFAKAIGMDVGHCDGNDPLASYELIQTHLNKIREGGGPSFLEFSTYRWREHCGPNYDNHIGYRTESEFEEWKLKDPVTTFRDKVISHSLIEPHLIESIENMVKKEVNEAFQFAEESKFPKVDSFDSYLYESEGPT